MTRRVLPAAAVLALAVAAPPTAAAAPLVKLVRGNAYEMRVDEDLERVRMPVDLGRRVRARNLRAVVISVARDRREEKAITDAFAAKVARGGDRGPAVILDVTTEPALEQGTYSIVLDVVEKRGRRRPTGGRRAPRKTRLTVELVHPAATLRPPAPLRIEDTGGFLWWKRDTDKTPLPLRETGGKSRLTDVHVLQVDRPAGDAASDGAITFAAAPVVAPRGKEDATYELTGDFDHGETSGVVEVEAPQLEAAVPVSYVVQRRRHPAWIAVIALIGVLAGYLLRVGLKNMTDRSRARLRGIEVAERMDAELKRRNDATFQTEVTAALGTLRTSLQNEKDAMKLTTAADTAHSALERELSALDDRRHAAAQGLEELQVLVATAWSAPKAVRDALDTAEDGFADVAKAIDDYDAGGAAAKVGELRHTMTGDVVEAAKGFRGDVRAFLERLEGVTPPERLRDDVRRERAQLAAALERPVLDVAKPKAEEVLDAVHEIHTRLQRLVREVLPLVTLTVDDVRRALPEADGDLPGRVKDFDARLAAAADGKAKPGDAADATGELLGALRKAILDLAPEAVKADAEQRLDRGRYVDAAGVVAAARARPRDTRLGRAGAAATAQGAPDGAGEGALAAGVGVQAPTSARVAGVRLRDRDPLAGLRSVRFLSWAEGIQASIVRTLIIGVLVALGAYAAFQPTWDGSLDEIIAIFFWGFGLDLGVESVLDSVRGTKDEEAAAAKA